MNSADISQAVASLTGNVRKSNIIYWIITVWLTPGMITTGIVQLMKRDEEVLKMAELTVNDKRVTLFGPSLLVILTVLSWYYRPSGRKMQITA